MSNLGRSLAVCGFAVALAIPLSGGSAWADPDYPGGSGVVPITITTDDGYSFSATPDGNRYLVDRSVDPDGFIVNHEAPISRLSVIPPACVTASVDLPGNVTQTVRVRNSCATEQRVKVLVAFSNDSNCMILASGSVGIHAFNILPDYLPYPGVEPRFDGLQAC